MLMGVFSCWLHVSFQDSRLLFWHLLDVSRLFVLLSSPPPVFAFAQKTKTLIALRRSRGSAAPGADQSETFSERSLGGAMREKGRIGSSSG